MMLRCFLLGAEREGFEPPEPLSSSVFKTGAFGHSANPPVCGFSSNRKGRLSACQYLAILCPCGRPVCGLDAELLVKLPVGAGEHLEREIDI